MKIITAIVKPYQLDAIQTELGNSGFIDMTITDAKGRDSTQDGAPYVPRVRIEMVVKDEHVQQIVDTIVAVAQTGRSGDGKVWVTPVEEVVRIRTGDRGDAAL